MAKTIEEIKQTYGRTTFEHERQDLLLYEILLQLAELNEKIERVSMGG